MSARGARKEHRVADLLRSDGWVVYRSSGSHGCADLVALKAGMYPMLVQVKGSVRPYEHFGRLARLELAHEAIAARAVPQLVHWPPRGVPTFIGWHEWPDTPGLPALKIEHELAQAAA